MKKSNVIYSFLIGISILLFFTGFLKSQPGFECSFSGIQNGYDNISLSDFWGLKKPIRTDISGVNPEPPHYAYFPVLVVFVQFADDHDLPQWPAPTLNNTGAPDFLNNFIAESKNYNANWC